MGGVRRPLDIAIIGMACRFAGASDWRAYWRNLLEGTESVTFLSDAQMIEAGVDPARLRHPDYVKAAFLLPEADAFDPSFFGYSPHEARLIDPQQRHLLEVSWEAFEDAGYPPGQDFGPVGVYAATGSVVTNYMMNELADHPDARGATASLLHIGNDKDFAGTRVSFKLNLTGPSLNVQTACSTSLVLVHLACNAIQGGECAMALAAAGIVRVPQAAGYMGVKGAIFAPDGHIRTFDAEAGGTVFSSGVAAMLFKRLDRAVADGDNIYGVIRGTALNNDGGRKASYAGTSVRGQTDVMKAALAQSGFDPTSIGSVECHGTGTTVGDPREFTALQRAFEGDRREGKCPIGSTKPNIGHSEQSAGLASMIKTALSMCEGVVPPTINYRIPNPRMKIEQSKFFVNTGRLPWPENPDHPRRALVNGLGIGGTNAVVVMEQAPAPRPRTGAPPRPRHLVVLSGKSAAALDANAARHRAWAESHPQMDMGDYAHTMAVGRTHFDHRFACVVASPAELATALAGFKADPKAARKQSQPRRLAFLFSGQGAQVAGMGRSLYATEPAFRAELDKVAAALDPHLDRPLLDVLFADGEDIHRTGYTQPCLFAVELALARTLEGWGIKAEAVCGHSVGEFAACVVAGVYSLEDAARLVATRGRMMQALPAGGAMSAVFAEEAVVAEVLAALDGGRIGIAAVNGPQGTVISGEAAEVDKAVKALEAKGFPSKALTVSHAFHSPLMDPALPELDAAAWAVTAKAPALAWVSTYTGQLKTDAPDAEYWCSQARQAVRFADAVAALVKSGIKDFVEIGPGGALLALGRSVAGAEGLGWLPTLGKGDGHQSLLETVGALYCAGNDPHWQTFDAPFDLRRMSLPVYAFQHERVWAARDYEPVGGRRPAVAQGTGLAGRRLPSPLAAHQYETEFSRERFGWLDDHRVHGAMVLPTTAGLVAALEGARARLGDGPLEVAGFSHGDALVLADDEARLGHLVVEPNGDGAGFSLSSRGGDDEIWRTHMRGEVRRAKPGKSSTFDAKALKRRCHLPVKADSYYAGMRSLGLAYGPSFRAIESLWRGEGEALARIRLPDQVEPLGNGLMHPALLDACLHVYPAVIEEYGDFTQPPPDGSSAHLPLGLERFSGAKSEEREVWVHAKRRKPNGHGADITVIDIEAFDPDGRSVAAFEGLSVKKLPASLFRPRRADGEDGWLYAKRWDERPVPALAAKASGPLTWLLLGGDGFAKSLKEALGRTGAACRVVSAKDCPTDLEGFSRLLEGFAAEAGAGKAGIIHLGAVDAPGEELWGEELWGDEAAQRRLYDSVLCLSRALGVNRTGFLVAPKLHLVTRNAVDALGTEPPAHVLGAGLWGLGRSFALEAPALWGGLVDLEAGGVPGSEAGLLAAHLAAADDEAQVALRGGKRLAARLVRAPVPPRRPAVADGGTYLVTGGLGALGVLTAEWLATARKAAHLVLVSRQGDKAANAAEVSARLEALGAKVTIAKADTAREADVAKLLGGLAKAQPPLRGIFHSAGVLDDGLVDQMEWGKFRRALAPKLDAGWWLHKHSRDLNLHDFVLYSSVLSVIGSAGQTNYTTGNACLDALAAHRRSLGLPALSVNWGAWASAGMADGLGAQGEAIWRARGIHYIEPGLGREAFEALFDGDAGHGVVIPADWPTFLRQFQVPPRFYAELQGAAAGGLAADIEALKQAMASADAGIRRAAITDFLARQVMTTLGMTARVDPDRPLRELGLDSLMSVTLINRVESATGIRIPAVKLIKGPSIDELVVDVWPDLAGVEVAAPAISDVAVDALVEDEAPKPSVNTGAGSWLVTVAPRANPRYRVFCFPFAGGGSAAFQAWSATTDPSIEVIAVEPPGRLARISETPVRDMDVFVDHVIDEMEATGKLDLPFALFGHCLGGLTLYEVARTLIHETETKPRHLFCSGARCPDRVRIVGPFEKNLAMHLTAMPGYKPNLPPYRQPDPIFAEIIRQFDMAASDQFLDDPELRRLMLPAVRAEFEMTSKYRYQPEKPWDVPITCFVSKGDPYVSRRDILGWGRFTNSRMQVYMREGTHYSIFEDAAFIQRVIGRELMAPPS
ncbi:type I polyketide synthase [Magnetospirillum sp. 15-1]|uniref:type I polyketide synthase n=1 Tax=Magnetospirillum sp. 15-1 TaxID=1979370 RepID=UPI000BBB8E8B|nr:type I polyketide synthase [Magnetospirillum sp. 15-1]